MSDGITVCGIEFEAHQVGKQRFNLKQLNSPNVIISVDIYKYIAIMQQLLYAYAT